MSDHPQESKRLGLRVTSLAKRPSPAYGVLPSEPTQPSSAASTGLSGPTESSSSVDEKAALLEQPTEAKTQQDGDDLKELFGNDEDAENRHRVKPHWTIFNYTNAIVGSGIIGIPFALKEAGVGLGILLLLLIGWINDFTLIILIEAGDAVGASTYQDLMLHSFGKIGYHIMTLIQAVYPFIALISYNIIIGDTMTKILIRFTGLPPDHNAVRREVVVGVVTLIIILPLALKTKIGQLAKVSMISVFLTCLVGVAMVIRFVTLSDVVPSSANAWEFFNMGGMTSAVAVIACAYICHHNSYLLYNSMESRSPHQWVQVTHVTVIVAGAMALFVGVVGYGTFTGFTEGDVMENYCWQDDLMTAARAIFCFTIMLTHPVEVFVVREVLTTAIFPSLSKSEHYYLMHILVSVAIVGIGYAASLITSCLGIVLELNGILAAIPLAYILPCACYLRCAPRAHISHRLFAAVILTCGIVVSLSGIVTMIARGPRLCTVDKEMFYCQPNYKFRVPQVLHDESHSFRALQELLTFNNSRINDAAAVKYSTK